jgi:hypothetical protein
MGKNPDEVLFTQHQIYLEQIIEAQKQEAAARKIIDEGVDRLCNARTKWKLAKKLFDKTGQEMNQLAEDIGYAEYTRRLAQWEVRKK